MASGMDSESPAMKIKFKLINKLKHDLIMSLCVQDEQNFHFSHKSFLTIRSTLLHDTNVTCTQHIHLFKSLNNCCQGYFRSL